MKQTKMCCFTKPKKFVSI